MGGESYSLVGSLENTTSNRQVYEESPQDRQAVPRLHGGIARLLRKAFHAGDPHVPALARLHAGGHRPDVFQDHGQLGARGRAGPHSEAVGEPVFGRQAVRRAG